MSNTAAYALRLPLSLKDQLTKVAKRDGTSLNQFIVMAVAEKISALETETFFIDKAKAANQSDFAAILFRQQGGEPPRDGDQILD